MSISEDGKLACRNQGTTAIGLSLGRGSTEALRPNVHLEYQNFQKTWLSTRQAQ